MTFGNIEQQASSKIKATLIWLTTHALVGGICFAVGTLFGGLIF